MEEFMVDLGKVANKLTFSELFLYFAIFIAAVILICRFAPRLRRYTGQIAVLASVAWVASLFVIITFSFPIAKGALATATRASSIPRLWAALLVPVVVMTLLPMLKGTEEPDKPFDKVGLVLIVFACVAASVVMFDYVGYYVSSALFIFVVMLLLKERNKIALLTVPLGWVAFSWLVFYKLLFVPLPIGRWFS